jgi:hypothetical protein
MSVFCRRLTSHCSPSNADNDLGTLKLLYICIGQAGITTEQKNITYHPEPVGWELLGDKGLQFGFCKGYAFNFPQGHFKIAKRVLR